MLLWPFCVNMERYTRRYGNVNVNKEPTAPDLHYLVSSGLVRWQRGITGYPDLTCILALDAPNMVMDKTAYHCLTDR